MSDSQTMSYLRNQEAPSNAISSKKHAASPNSAHTAYRTSEPGWHNLIATEAIAFSGHGCCVICVPFGKQEMQRCTLSDLAA